MNLYAVTVLHPHMKEAEAGERSIGRISQKIPYVFKDDQIPSVVDEWKLYQPQEIPKTGSRLMRLEAPELTITEQSN